MLFSRECAKFNHILDTNLGTDCDLANHNFRESLHERFADRQSYQQAVGFWESRRSKLEPPLPEWWSSRGPWQDVEWPLRDGCRGPGEDKCFQCNFFVETRNFRV